MRKQKRTATDLSKFYFLLVSLYIFILAFFVLLQSISEIDRQRHNQALASIATKFTNKEFAKQFEVADGSNHQENFDLVKTLEMLFNQQLFSKHSNFNGVTILIPTAEFFGTDQSHYITIYYQTLLESLATLLQNNSKNNIQVAVIPEQNYDNLSDSDAKALIFKLNALKHLVINLGQKNFLSPKIAIAFGNNIKIKITF